MKEIKNLIPKSIKFSSATDDLYSQCNSFIENIFQKGRSPLTIREYARTIAHFIEYLENYLGHSVRLKDIKQLDKIVAKLRAEGETVNPSEVSRIANQLIKSGQYKTEPSVAGKMIKKMLNSDLAKAIAGKQEQKGKGADPLKLVAPKKKNKGANDYRSGGYVLNTTDNRKVKRNGK